MALHVTGVVFGTEQRFIYIAALAINVTDSIRCAKFIIAFGWIVSSRLENG